MLCSSKWLQRTESAHQLLGLNQGVGYIASYLYASDHEPGGECGAVVTLCIMRVSESEFDLELRIF